MRPAERRAERHWDTQIFPILERGIRRLPYMDLAVAAKPGIDDGRLQMSAVIHQSIRDEGKALAILAQTQRTVVSIDVVRWYVQPAQWVWLGQRALERGVSSVVAEVNRVSLRQKGENVSLDENVRVGLDLSRLAELFNSDNSGLSIVRYTQEDPGTIAQRASQTECPPIAERLVRMGAERYAFYQGALS